MLIDLTSNVPGRDETSMFALQLAFVRVGVGYPVPADCKTIQRQMFAEGVAENRALLINHY